MKVLITGVAGFIGGALAKLLLNFDYTIVGIDNLNDYYDVSLKKARIKLLEKERNFKFQLLDLIDYSGLIELFETHQFDMVINLAAQAGVRHSFKDPRSYINSNITGFFNILESCRQIPPQHLVYASSSSVYGGTTEKPSKETMKLDKPLTLYAVTKQSNELMAYSYANLFKIPSTGLRFFSVYGPWGRPDMALFKFVKNIYEGKTIELYNNGDMVRDFTYIDDITHGIHKIMLTPPTLEHCEDNVLAKVYNIGRGNPVTLLSFVEAIENEIGKKAIIKHLPMQQGDVALSHADITALKALGYSPKTQVKEGIHHFVNWYKQYYGLIQPHAIAT
ncbi:MAG: GDP-mannose 4,6-dehydratase [Proteobacteria bacterium]|nr:GDP-mannose 4,6-dehydratase [Pseudomonadota bacterium]